MSHLSLCDPDPVADGYGDEKRLCRISLQENPDGVTLDSEIPVGQLRLWLLPLPILFPSYLLLGRSPEPPLMKVLLTEICFRVYFLENPTCHKYGRSPCQCPTPFVTPSKRKDLPLVQKCSKSQVRYSSLRMTLPDHPLSQTVTGEM